MNFKWNSDRLIVIKASKFLFSYFFSIFFLTYVILSAEINFRIPKNKAARKPFRNWKQEETSKYENVQETENHCLLAKIYPDVIIVV